MVKANDVFHDAPNPDAKANKAWYLNIVRRTVGVVLMVFCSCKAGVLMPPTPSFIFEPGSFKVLFGTFSVR